MLRNWCKEYTDLSDEDIKKLESIEDVLQMIAELVKADVFIDCLTRNRDVAIVVAEAKPYSGNSRYKHSVVGQIALRKNEPAALRTLEIGLETNDLRAVTQENIVVKQNVVPIKNASGKVIGALIIETDITDAAEYNPRMEILSETAEQLTQSLINFRAIESDETISSHLNDALVMFNDTGMAIFANAVAEDLYRRLGYKDTIVGIHYDNLVLDEKKFNRIISEQNVCVSEIAVSELALQVKYVVTRKNKEVIGLTMLIKEITDLKEKEKELIVKAVAIKEIHHRVKNNLQTIASLLRLQSRRTKNDEVKKHFNESINRIMCIAVTHEILSQNGVDEVDIKTIITKIKDNVLNCSMFPNQNICAEIKGDSFEVDSDRSTSIALVINELLQNSLEHGFIDRHEGCIEIVIQKGAMYSSISVMDDGCGFDVKSSRTESLGLNIVQSVIHDKLNGSFNIVSSEKGTKILFDFENKDIEDKGFSDVRRVL